MDAFAALADPTRRQLVDRLARGPAQVVDLAAEHPISRPAISRHLRVLGAAGLVTASDRGRERHYRLERSGLGPVTTWLIGLVGDAGPAPRFAESVLDGLDLEVRRTVRDHASGQTAPTTATQDPAQETA